MPTSTDKYPETPARPLVLQAGRRSYVDPYVWLEDDSPESLDWQARQQELTDRYFSAWPHLDSLAQLLSRWSEGSPAGRWDSHLEMPVVRGRRWFRTVMETGTEQKVLKVFDGTSERGRLLLDLQAAAVPETLDWWYVSPRGRYVAFGASRHGDEQSVLRVLDVDSAVLLPEELPYASNAAVGWLPDETGFYVALGDAPDAVDAGKALYLHRLGTTAPGERQAVDLRWPIFATPSVSEEGRYVALLQYPGGGAFRLTHFLDRQDGRGWRAAIQAGEEPCHGVFIGDDYFAITRDGAPRGRLVAIPTASGVDVTTWRELIPETDAVLESFVRIGNGLAVAVLENAISHVQLYDLDGRRLGEVPLPDSGCVADLAAEPGRPDRPESVLISFSSLTRSPALLRYTPSTVSLVEIEPPRHCLENVVVRRLVATSADGTSVPATIAMRRDIDSSQPQPALIHGYGGFNKRFVPKWDLRCAAVVESGGIYVMAHLRGGAEFGSDWWRGGRMANKQHTFDDAYAIAEALIAQGLTSREKLALTGSSNGGLLAGAAAAQRPDLFRAVVALVPILDLLRAARDPFPGRAVRLEYGDVEQPDQAEWLASYSPYDAEVAEATATFVGCGANDIRCPAWHSRKLVAKLQQRGVENRPVLLRVWPEVGHMTGITQSSARGVLVEPLAFIMRELGLTPPQSGRGKTGVGTR